MMGKQGEVMTSNNATNSCLWALCSELEIITHVIDKQTPKHFSLESKLMLLLHECGLFINPSFFFYWGGGKNKDIRSKKEHAIWKGFNWCCLVFIKYMYLKNHIIIEISLGVSIGFIKTVVNFMDDIKEIHKTCIMHRLKR